MRSIGSLVLLAVASLAIAQSAPTPVRIRVRHADPWLIKALLEGRQVSSPEISTVLGISGNRSSATPQGGAPLIAGGTIMVNPTDNSIWYIPNGR